MNAKGRRTEHQIPAKWDRLSELVHQGRLFLREPSAAATLEAPLATASMMLAMRLLKGRSHLDMRGLSCAGALALAMRERLLVHELRAPVPRTIAETDLHSLPPDPPRLLRSAFVLEVRDPKNESLLAAPSSKESWRNTAAIGGVEINGKWRFAAQGWPDGWLVSNWRPSWGHSLDAGELVPWASDEVERNEHYDFAVDVVRTVVVLALLLDAEHSPIQQADEGPRLKGESKGVFRPARPWAVRRLFLDGARSHENNEKGSNASGNGVEGRTAASIAVRGHLKMQAHGPNNSLRKLVYVAEYGARRWIAPRPTRVVVAQGKNDRRE